MKILSLRMYSAILIIREPIGLNQCRSEYRVDKALADVGKQENEILIKSQRKNSADAH